MAKEYNLDYQDGKPIIKEGGVTLRVEGFSSNGMGDLKATLSLFQADSLKFRDLVNLSKASSRQRFITRARALIPNAELSLDNPLLALDELLRQEKRQEPEASIKKEGEPEYSAMLPGLVEIVEHEGKPAYLSKEGEDVKLDTEALFNEKVYSPPPIEQIPWLLPRADKVLYWLNKDTDSALYNSLLEYHASISDLPSDSFYDLLVCWDFHTYLVADFEYSPILSLYAVAERGKSRTGKGLVHVAYRGIRVESLREAYLVRVANNFGATVFFDVKDIWRKAEKEGSEDILLNRFEKGAKVPRVLYPDRGAHKDTVYYDIFGPTIIASNEAVHHILDTRAIQVNMPEATRQFENIPRPEDGLELKERLTAFRARHLGKPLTEIRKPANGRLGDIMKPLFQILALVKPERKARLTSLTAYLEEKRLTEKVNTLEARLVWIINGLIDKVKDGILYVSTITDTYNENKPERLHLTPEKIGRVLSSLGFEKSRGEGGRTYMIYDPEKINKLVEAYGLRNPSEPSELTEP